MHRDGGGILMELTQVDLELVNDVPDQGRQQGGAIGAAQVIEGATDPVVIEEVDLAGLQPQVLGDAPFDPVGQGIMGAFQNNIADLMAFLPQKW
jgi:hypothetical protein